MGLELPKRVRRMATGVLVTGSLLMLGACSSADQAQINRLAMPEGVTKQAPYIYDLWRWSWLAAIITGVIVWGLIGYVSFRYRRRSETDVPVQTRYNLPIEIFYTIAPIIMVIVLFYWTVTVQDKVLADEPNPDHTIDVVGQQWSWTFNYMNEDAIGGKTVFEAGTASVIPTLYLPVDQSITVNLSSPDVIHSFWVPAFLFKMDVVPGRSNHFSFTPTRVGTYVGRCAELCGVYHSKMLFSVHVVSQTDYKAHLRKLETDGNIGPALGGADARTQAGYDQDGGTE